MAKPLIHAKSSARRYGGIPEDYLPIHDLMDSSKSAIGDQRHRSLTHNAWFIGTILEKIFGHVIVNSAGREVSVRDIGEQHVLEDYGMKFIPSAQDFLCEMELKDWMNNGQGSPPSMKKVIKETKKEALSWGEFCGREDRGVCGGLHTEGSGGNVAVASS